MPGVLLGGLRGMEVIETCRLILPSSPLYVQENAKSAVRDVRIESHVQKHLFASVSPNLRKGHDVVYVTE